MCLLFFFSTTMWRLGFRGVRGVCGAVERRHAAPAVVGRLGLVLDTVFGFWGHGRTTKPPSPQALFFEQETATELGSRFPFFCGFKNYRLYIMNITPRRRGKSPCLLAG